MAPIIIMRIITILIIITIIIIFITIIIVIVHTIIIITIGDVVLWCQRPDKTSLPSA